MFAADGTITRIIGFSPVTSQPAYTLHFVDGQTVEAGADHLWKVGTADGRAAWRTGKKITRTARAIEFTSRATDLRALAATFAIGTVAPMSDIARLLRANETWLNSVIPRSLGTQLIHPSLKKASQFDTAALKSWAINASKVRRGVFTLAGHAFTPADLERLFGAGEYLTAKQIGDTLMGRRATRSELDLVKQAARRSGAARRESTTTVMGTVYPLDEVLTLLAERAEFLSTRSDSGVAAQPLETVVSTADMFASVHRTTTARTTKNYAVRLPAPIAGSSADLPIHPLALGMWLGDGVSRFGQIASATADSCRDGATGLTDQHHLIQTLRELGYAARPAEWEADRLVVVPELHTQLRGLGLLQRKHIPAIYLRASVDQRLDLLRGLMDTDGTVDANGSCALDLCNETLVRDALEIIRSLGIKAAMTTGVAAYTITDPHTGEKTRTVTGTRWRINFTTTMQVFTLPRKARGIKTHVRPTQDWNYIKAITMSDPVPMRCLMVDHPEHLYLTDGFIPTHNSVSLQAFLHGWVRKGWPAAVIDPSKGAADFKFAEPWCTAFATDVAAAAALMKELYAEVSRRKDRNAAAGVGSFRDLEDPPRPYLIVIDEFTSLIGASPVPPPSDDPEVESERQDVIADNGYRSMIGAMAGKIAREARSAGFTLILGTQRLTAKMLDPIPGSQDLRTNLSRMLVGKATTGEMQSALRAPFDAPSLGAIVPRGRALWETSAGAGQAVQGWYAPQTDLAADLLSRLAPMDPADRIDVGSIMPKAAPVTGVTEEVSFLGELEFSLDDFDLTDDDETDEEDDSVDEAPDTDADDNDPMGPAVEPMDEETTTAEHVQQDTFHEPVVAESADPAAALPRPAPFTHVTDPALTGTLVCLDIDGVLAPLGPDNAEWTGWEPVDAGATGRVSAEMLARINALGCTMAWLSSWQHEAPTVFTGLLPFDMPVIARPTAAEIWWKIDALLGHLTEHPDIRRVAFADDHLDDEDELGLTYRETLAEALDYRGVEHLLIAPNKAIGLTVDDVESIEVWLQQPPAVVPAPDDPEPAPAAFQRPDPPSTTVPSRTAVPEHSAGPADHLMPAPSVQVPTNADVFDAPASPVPAAPIRRFQTASQGGTDFD